MPLAGLVPLDEIAWSSDLEKRRALGLAYLEVADARLEPEAHRFYRQNALDLLSQVRTEAADADVEAALARIYWEGSPRRAAAAALAALNQGRLSLRAKVNALCVVGDTYF